MKDFHGVKIALLCDDEVLVYLRDDKPSITFAGLWDLPGGGREKNETPHETAMREVHEEFGININPSQIVFSKRYPSMSIRDTDSVFMVGHIRQEQIILIQFGSEGQRYKMVKIDEFLQMEDAVQPLQERLSEFLTMRTPNKL